MKQLISHEHNPPELLTARDYLKQLTTLLETDGLDEIPQIALLSQLQVNLLTAVEDYELFCQNEVEFEDCLVKQSNLLWLCNQCGYQHKAGKDLSISR